MKKVEKTKKTSLVLTMILFIVVALAATSFAWFTDKANVDVSNNLKFGLIKLSASSALNVDVERTVINYTSGGKLMPGDTLVAKVDVSLDSKSSDAFYLVKIKDTYGFLEESYYFADGTTDSNGDLVIYKLVIGESGTSTVIQGTTTASDKVVGKISKSAGHTLKIKVKIPEDFTDENVTTKIYCDIGAIQQANLSEASAQAKLIEGVECMIPSEYKTVDYIQSTGTQYINTGFIPNNLTGVEIEASVTESGKDMALLGCRPSGVNSRQYIIWFHDKDSNNAQQVSLSYYSLTDETEIGEVGAKVLLKLDGGELYCDGNLIHDNSKYNTTFSTDNEMILMGMSQAGVVDSRLFRGKIYDCKIYNSGTLVRHFVPVVRISDVTAGLFDTVEGKFYENQGTGSFTTPSVAEGYTDVNYIEATGTQYINTGVNINGATQLFNIDLSIKWNDLSSRQLMGYSANSEGYFGVQTNGYYENGIVTTEFKASTTSYDHVIFSNDETSLTLSVNGETNSRGRDTKSGELQLLNLVSGNYKCKADLAYCKVTVDGVLVRDFVPVVSNSDKVAGLYDKVNGVFYASSGTRAFNWG